MTTGHVGGVSASGGVTLQVLRRWPPLPPRAETTAVWLRKALRRGLPTTRVPREVNRWRVANLRYLQRGMRQILLYRALRAPVFYGALSLEVCYASGRRVDLGLVGLRVVTDAGVAFIVNAFQNLVEPETMKFHGLGTGTTAEAAAQTALVTELTTEYNPDNTRATGNLTTGASANIFHTEATNTLDGTPAAALREHSVFSQAAAPGGTMLDRTLYAAITLSAGDGLLSKYELTLTSGG
jgi:hypothetical protein